MKVFFKSILVAFFTWTVFRVVYLIVNGNSVQTSAKSAIGAPVRFLGALIKILTTPAQARAAVKTIRSDFSGVKITDFKGMQSAWSNSLVDVYNNMSISANDTSQNSQTVNSNYHSTVTPPVSPTGIFPTDPATALSAWGNSASQLNSINMTQ